jgi:hypothetical protein
MTGPDRYKYKAAGWLEARLGGKQEAGSRKQEARSRKQEAGSRKQEARSKKISGAKIPIVAVRP